MSEEEPILRGVDGCPAGWLCISLEPSGNKCIPQTFADAAALFRDAERAITTIDIPIGLAAKHPRECDREARRQLGSRRSSVFPAPLRCTLSATSYKEADAASRHACGKGISKQTFEILPKIREVDEQFTERPSLIECVFEVHPEVSFCYWNGKPMHYSKKTGFGFLERFRLVEQAFPGAAEEVRSAIPRKDASDDDILDALAALWTARRIRADTAVHLVDQVQYDDRGLPMRMMA